MEQVKVIRNSFVSPVSRSKGVDFSDDLVIVTELVDFVEQGPSGDSSDFVIYKKPIEVERYHHNKVISERSKGASLKEIVAQCERSGDYSTLSQRKVIFGDGFITPRSLGDAFEYAEKGAQVLDGLSESERDNLISLSKMTKSEFDAFIKSEVEKQLGNRSIEKKEGEKNGD